MRKQIVKYIAACLTTVGVTMLLLSCGGLNADEAEDTMITHLQEKYGKPFSAEAVENKNVGQNFGLHRYFFRIADEKQDVFDASMDEDGSHPDDNYAKVLFGKEIEAELLSILDSYPGLEVETFSPKYELTEETWLSREEYMKSEDFCLWCDIKPTAPTEEEAIREVHNLMTEMNEKGYGFMVTIHYGGKTLITLCDDNHPLKTEAELLEIWRTTDE